MTAQTILPANSAASGGYDVANSVRFNSADSPKMVKSSTAGNRTNWTFSAWFKRSGLGATQDIMASSGGASSGDYCYLQINSDDKMRFLDYSSGNECNKITNRLFRDPSAWMNVVLVINTNDGTAEDRFKLYINGVRETSFATSANFSDGYSTNMNVNGHSNAIGTNNQFNALYWDGYLAEIVLVDGTTLAPEDNIGEFDEDSGIWKPIDVSGLTFGNNGFYLDFEASDNLGNDANGGTDFTETNLAATDQSTDTCTNNFATFNPLNVLGSNIAYSENNLTITPGTSDYKTCISSIAVDSGKWYAEFKAVSGHNGSTDVSVGIVGADDHIASTGSKAMSAYTSSFSYGSGGLVKKYNDSTIRTDATYTDDDIIGIAVDMDNLKLYWSKNGTYNNSGDPTSGATGTGAVAITPAQLYYIAVATISSGGVKVFAANFGSPPYSEGGGETDGDGYGNFAHAVPSGYFALNTKNLAEDGG